MKLNGLVVSGLLANDLKERIRSAVAAAADARMAGENVPIYGCFGSGNHGITLFLTLGLAAEDQCSSREELARALALALLVVGVIKCRTGILTPHCGCAVAAGSGAAAGLVLLLGGTPKQAENAVQLMTANLTGMLCDGAKYGCALKISTSAGVALESAYLAVYAEAALPGGNGLVGRTLEESMENLQTITEVGMAQVDRAVLEILLARTRRGCP
jgi:L-cysteine desulfidase